MEVGEVMGDIDALMGWLLEEKESLMSTRDRNPKAYRGAPAARVILINEILAFLKDQYPITYDEVIDIYEEWR
jgi:hypothetical protein